MSHIFNIGLSRAGTSSLSEALNILGYSVLHHRYHGRRLPQIIKENDQAGKRLFDGLEHFDGFMDFSGWNHYRKLDHQYPGSLFIFTWRERRSWIESQKRWNWRMHGRKMSTERLEELYNKATGIWSFFKGRDDILVIDITGGQGWEKLCPFLDRRIPNISFPHQNRSI